MAPRLDPTPRQLAPVFPTSGVDAPAPHGVADPTVRPLVLAVDDDPVQREFLWAVLRQGGFDVALATDGEHTLTLADDLRPDVIVTDALMPHSSGFDLIEQLRAHAGQAWVPTIVISGSHELATRLDAFAIGADDFLAKPYTPAELVARVNAQLRVAAQLSAQTAEALRELRAGRVASPRHDPVMPRPAGAHGAPGPGHAEPATRCERAEAVLATRPGALACATVVLADEQGAAHWLPHRTLADWAMIAPATEGLGPDDPSVDLHLGAADRCPLCGGAGEGRVLLTTAGGWDGGDAYLLVGCQSPARQTHRVLAEQLALEIGAEIDDAPHRRFADVGARAWIDRLIDDGNFRFVYQPIVTITSQRVVGYEALARFDGLGPLDVLDVLDVLDLATRAGRRVSLELALVRGALAGARVFHPGTWIHINVSPLAALAPELAEIVAAAGQHVVVEITENALFDADGVSTLRAVLPPNCRLAIDDVGAGYAGLSRLLDVRPDIVKVDRAVISGIDDDPARQALVAGLVQFGCVTDAMVIAEGIETEAERETLRRLGVRFAQGFLFSLPLAAER